MVAWTGISLQIVLALIGSSGVFVVGIGGYLSEFNQPHIEIWLYRDEGSYH